MYSDEDELDNMEEAIEAFSEAFPSICSYNTMKTAGRSTPIKPISKTPKNHIL
jgi:hypothetical protein